VVSFFIAKFTGGLAYFPGDGMTTRANHLRIQASTEVAFIVEASDMPRKLL
jgi:hypothetical protein